MITLNDHLEKIYGCLKTLADEMARLREELATRNQTVCNCRPMTESDQPNEPAIQEEVAQQIIDDAIRVYRYVEEGAGIYDRHTGEYHAVLNSQLAQFYCKWLNDGTMDREAFKCWMPREGCEIKMS